jgi:hypothetical protein
MSIRKIHEALIQGQPPSTSETVNRWRIQLEEALFKEVSPDWNKVKIVLEEMKLWSLHNH